MLSLELRVGSEDDSFLIHEIFLMSLTLALLAKLKAINFRLRLMETSIPHVLSSLCESIKNSVPMNTFANVLRSCTRLIDPTLMVISYLSLPFLGRYPPYSFDSLKM